MRNRLKKIGCYLIIIVLLPYIVTVFMNGPAIPTDTTVDTTYVKVKKDDTELELPLEEYCIGRMAKEIPAAYEEEALKAQAVIVRTSVYKSIKEGGTQVVLEDDFWTEEEMRQQWGSSYSGHYRKMQNAWNDTEGQVVMYGENLANTPFTRLTNGNTRDGKEVLGSEDYPYLKIKDCPLDIEAAEQIQTVTVDDMDAEVTAMDTAGYVTSVRVGQETVNGEEFRQTYGLASSCFILQKYDGKLRITTRGVGHGLGLSQYTANEMAKEGKDVSEILQYFFEGTEIKEVAEIVTNSRDTE
uniref:SpoIID/LytB domain-containing protein n=1 Tax=Lachnoclostridium phocaeense TaxID=1871021 RepID=UPI0026DC19EA|nr:SpoIID/LytB domain-containing protein [Lachnoclostridium phocaeense]